MNMPYAAPPAATDAHVVVVEDDDILRLLTLEVVMELGLPVLAFSNADEAWAHLTAGAAAMMLITDHSMPGNLSGNDLASLSVREYPTVPVILTSGYGYAAEHTVPGVTFLPKPWAVDTLAALVSALLLPSAAGQQVQHAP